MLELIRSVRDHGYSIDINSSGVNFASGVNLGLSIKIYEETYDGEWCHSGESIISEYISTIEEYDSMIEDIKKRWNAYVVYKGL